MKIAGRLFSLEITDLGGTKKCATLRMSPHEKMVFSLAWIRDLKTVLDTFIAGYGPEINTTTAEVERQMKLAEEILKEKK